MAPSATMLKSAAYNRMRKENPSEFVPKSVFFTHDNGSEIDRGNSFWVKAALVYESITGQHVNDVTKPDAHRLLLRLARRCCSIIHPKQEASGVQATKEAETGPGTDADQKTQESHGGKTTELPDEGSAKNKQVIDGIFLVVGFLSRLKKAVDKAGMSVSRGGVDESFKSMHMQDIVTDVIKLENQLPVKDLLDVVDHVEKAVNDTLTAEFKHLQRHLKNKKYELEFKRNNFHEVIHCFCWYYSPFFNKNTAAPEESQSKSVADDHKMAAAPEESQSKNVADDHKMAAAPEESQSKSVADDHKMDQARTLLDYLHSSLVPRSSEGTGAGGVSVGKTSRMPTARKLSRSGMRFDAGDDGRAGVEFDDQSSRLRLPALVYDFKLATVARNLLAQEYEEQSKPVTRYFQMMNELVEEVADVRILRRAGVVRGGSRGAHEVHELIKKIDGYATYPSVFMAMDLQIEKVKQFHDKRMKNFLVRHRTGVIWASSVAAMSVIAIVAARKKRA